MANYGPSAAPAEHLPTEAAGVLRGHEGPVLCVRFNPAGTYCLSGGKDRAIRLWNPHRGILVKTYSGHGYEVRDVAVATDNSKFASVGGDRQVFYWDVASAQIIRKFRGHDAAVNAVRYGPGNETLVTAGYDQAVKVWDCRSRSIDPIQVMKPFRDSVTSVAVTTRAEIVAGSVDGSVRRFDIRMGRLFTDEVHHPVSCVAVSRDNHCMLAACMDSTLRLLDRADGELLAEYSGHTHTGIKMDCAFTPGDGFVVASSEDGRVLYWELVGGELAGAFQAAPDAVTSLAIAGEGKDGATLLTASTDGIVRVWK